MPAAIRTAVVVVGLMVLLAAALGGWDEEDDKMARLLPGLKRHLYRAGDRTVHYVAAGDPGRPLAILVHGSPGDWTAFETYLTNADLLRQIRMISVDRPGFGESDFGNSVADIARQAALLSPLLDQAGAAGAVLVGHSLGGSVVARMTMDFPTNVKGLLMVAPSLDPELETPRWYNRLGNLAVIRQLLPQALDTSNQEILPLRGELEKMLPFWSAVRVPTIVIHGLRDKLVPPANADFAARALQNAPHRVERIQDAGHFVLWERPGLIKAALLELALGRPVAERTEDAHAESP